MRVTRFKLHDGGLLHLASPVLSAMSPSSWEPHMNRAQNLIHRTLKYLDPKPHRIFISLQTPGGMPTFSISPSMAEIAPVLVGHFAILEGSVVKVCPDDNPRFQQKLASPKQVWTS